MRAITIGRALILSVAGLSALPAIAATPAEDLVRDWLEQSSFGLAVTIGSSRFDPATQSVEMENVRIGRPGEFLAAVYDRFTVEDPRRTPDGMFAAHSIRASDVGWTIHVDPERWFPALVEAARREQAEEQENTPPPAADGDGPAGDDGPDFDFDVAAPPKPFDIALHADVMLYERPVLPYGSPDIAEDAFAIDRYLAIAKWYLPSRIDWFEMNNLVLGTDGLPGGDNSTSYGLYFLSGVHDGRIERFGINDLKQTTTVEGRSQELSVGNVYGVGLDGNAMLEVLDPSRFENGVGDGKWRPAILQSGYNDISITFPEGSLKIGNIEADGIRLRQSGKPLLPMYADMIADPARIEKDPLPFMRDLLPAALGLYGVDFVQVNNVEVTGPEEVTLSLGEIDVNGMDSDGIGAISVRDMAVEAGANGSGRLSLFSMADLRFGSLMALIELGMASDSGEPPPDMVRRAVLEGTPALGMLELSGLSIDTPAGSIGLDAFAATAGDYLQQFARRADTTFTRFTMPVSMITDPTTREMLVKMGYQQINVSGAITYHWNTDTGDFYLLDATVKADEMGVLSADLHLGNVPLALLDDPEAMERKLREVTIVDGSLVFGNQSIVEKVFEVQAEPLHQEPEQFRKNFGAGMPLMLGFLGNKQIQDRLADALKTFFDDPKSLKITIRPAAPVPFGVMETMDNADPGEVLHLLNLQAEANK